MLLFFITETNLSKDISCKQFCLVFLLSVRFRCRNVSWLLLFFCFFYVGHVLLRDALFEMMGLNQNRSTRICHSLRITMFLISSDEYVSLFHISLHHFITVNCLQVLYARIKKKYKPYFHRTMSIVYFDVYGFRIMNFSLLLLIHFSIYLFLYSLFVYNSPARWSSG